MAKWADYVISKVEYTAAGILTKVIAHKDLGDEIESAETELSRNLIEKLFKSGKTFVTGSRNTDGEWIKLASVYLNISFGKNFISIIRNSGKDDIGDIPINCTKRKSFLSFYQKEDSSYRIDFENLTKDLIINKSVQEGDIDSDVSDEYAKQLIQKEYLKDTTVLVVLLGEKTKCRKHIDWEISGALNYKVGDNYAGILGLILPTHPDFDSDKINLDNLPERLADNVSTDYAVIKDWTENRKLLQSYIEKAFEYRTTRKDKRVNSRPQMQSDTCE